MDNPDSSRNFTTPSPSTRKKKTRTPSSTFRLDTSPMTYTNIPQNSPSINFPSSFNSPQQFSQQFPQQYSPFSPQCPPNFSPSQFSPSPNPFGLNAYNPMNPPQYTPSSHQQIPFNIPDYDSDEIVGETQEPNEPEPEPATSKGKGKAKFKRPSRAKPQGRAPATKWTPDELRVLSEAWSNISNDKRVGNYQTNDAFWIRVLERFKMSIPNTNRTYDMLTSKFRDIKARVGLFCAKYNQLYTNRKSGQSDNDIFQQALLDYQTEAGSEFNMLQCWHVLKDCEKFKEICIPHSLSGGSSKRSRTSETPPLEFDLNEDTFTSSLNPERRRNPKKAASSSTSHCSTNPDILQTITDKISTLVHSVETVTLNMQQRQQKRDMEREERKMMKDIDYYFNYSTEGLSGSHLAYVLKRKAAIREKYNLED